MPLQWIQTLRNTIPYKLQVRKAAREGIWLPEGVKRRIDFDNRIPEKCDEIMKEV